MKSRRMLVVSIAMIITFLLLACSNNAELNEITIPHNDTSTTEDVLSPPQRDIPSPLSDASLSDSTEISEPPSRSSGVIFLYGEVHGVEKILDKEIELWGEYYNKQGMRHLFIEHSYYSAEFLNIWLQSDSDEILDALYSDWAGTAGHNPLVKEFFETIKRKYPETIFHGTDVGHQYDTTGERFLEYLRSHDLENSEHYHIAKEVIYQGKLYYKSNVGLYRENMMVENFIREFDKLGDENVMGIYGASHTGLESMDFTNAVPCMANQLKERYGDNIHSVNLSGLEKDIEPLRVDTIHLAGKDYEASYFGKSDMTGFGNYQYREYWRLENAYEDFMDNPKTEEVLPYNNFPMLIETGQVFVIDYTKIDGSVMRVYYRSDGNVWDDRPTTEAFVVE